jgi:DNA-3-methyladenine glycosylase II
VLQQLDLVFSTVGQTGYELSYQILRQCSDEEIEAALTAIPGISPWTVHGFLIIALDRPDVVLGGDLTIRRALKKVYGLDHMPTEQEMLQIAERWRSYRSLVVYYLFASEWQI